MNELEELTNITEYSKFKEAMDTEMKRSVESFVRIGYLLRRARDTSILHESKYSSVVEFAQAEYNIDKTQVSRFIAINERFSVNGYSDKLQDQYKRFGLAKLQEMLQLPDSVIEELKPEMTRETIQEVKREIKEELETTDLEVMLEEKAIIEESVIKQCFYLFFHDHTDRFENMYKIGCTSKFSDVSADEILEVIAPAGILAETARISGMGKFLVTAKAESYVFTATNVRTGEKEHIEALKLLEWFIKKYEPTYTKDFDEAWQQTYNEEFPKSKVAPVQTAPQPVNKPKTDNKPKEKPREKHQETKVQEENPLPDTTVEEKVEENPQVEEVENSINTECEQVSTTEMSTDNRAVVFDEMLAVTSKIVESIKSRDEEGIKEHLKELEMILASMAADNKEIPGQMTIDEI